MRNILTHHQAGRLALPLSPDGPPLPGADLEPYEVYGSLWGVEYYGKMLRILRQAGGYQLGDIRHPRPGDNAFVFLYDWRKDIVESAAQLGDALEHLQRSLGDPHLRFDLLAHSEGGLIARYFAKYGRRDVLSCDTLPEPDGSGSLNLDKLILLGTPNRGTLEALKILHQGVRKGFQPMPPRVTFTMPALYEMLPPRNAINFADLEGRPLALDIYDPETWIREGWSVFSAGEQASLREKMARQGKRAEAVEEENRRRREFLSRSLRRAELFQRALDAPAPPGAEPTTYAFGSDCISTLKTAVVLEENGRRETLFDPKRFRGEKLGERVAQILYGSGDGTVLMESLLGIDGAAGPGETPPRSGAMNLASAFFVCESHGLLPNDPIFQNNLFYLLLVDGAPQSAAGIGRSFPGNP